MALNLEQMVIECVVDALALDVVQARALNRSTLLQGGLPEFDSMGVLNLLTLLEDTFGIDLAEDIQAEALMSIGTLTDYITERFKA